MALPTLESFHHIIVCDTEYVATAGQPYDPVALGFTDYGSGQVHCYPRAEIFQWTRLPFPTDPHTLIVTFNSAAEAGFLHVLGLGMPVRWIDLMLESRARRNVCIRKSELDKFKRQHPAVYRPNQLTSLLDTASWLGLDAGDADSKELSRALVLSRQWEQGDPRIWQQILDYCAADVCLTEQVFTAMLPDLDVPVALLHGAYSAELGRMEQRGIPVDAARMTVLQAQYHTVLRALRQEVDSDSSRLTPKGRVSQSWLRTKITAIGALHSHARTEKDKLSARAEALRDTAEDFDDDELRRVAQWVELLSLLPENKEGGVRLSAIGNDGRARYSVFAFATHTGRSLGKGREALLQLPAWMRGFIHPVGTEVLVSADFAAEEFGVAAGLSGDKRMQELYAAGDLYSEVAAMAGVLTTATPAEEHGKIRRLFKSLVLGRMYGMSFETFLRRSGVARLQAVHVWEFFNRHFARFLRWQTHTVDIARDRGWIMTPFGWRAQVYDLTRTTSLLNWIIQAAAGDILRLGVLSLARANIATLTTAHDSFLVSLPEDQVDEQCAVLVSTLQGAAEQVCGIPIRVDTRIVRSGERWLTTDTRPQWDRIMGLIEQQGEEGGERI